MANILLNIVGIFGSWFKCNYLYNQKFFLIFLFHFWNLHQILNILKKKMIVIATLFRKFQTVKDLVRPLFKKHHFRNSFDNQHVKESQSLAKYAWEHFHHIFSSLCQTLIWKNSPLVICWILGVFRNTLTANAKYPVRDCENLSSPIQMQLSLYPKFFSDWSFVLLEFTSNFKDFQKKDDLHSYFLSEITDCQRLG